MRIVFRLLYNIIRSALLKTVYGSKFICNGYCFISPSTKIKIGKGRLEVGKNIAIEERGYVSTSTGGQLTIGHSTFINANCHIGCRNKINIGNDCIIGPNVSIYDHNHKFDNKRVYKNEYSNGTVVIGDGCWIGDGAKILKGSNIGEGTIIGAGVVVSSTIEPHSIVKQGANTVIHIE